MQSLSLLEPVDYLVIGHLAYDIGPGSPRLGGTAAYAARTAQAMGLRTGIVTTWGGEISLEALQGIQVVAHPTERSTTFENITHNGTRQQILHHLAPALDYHLIPEAWRQAPIVHLGPIAQEVEPGLVRRFPNALIGVTPQGWLRQWDEAGRISASEWPEASFVLENAGAAVLSVEDVATDESRIEEFVNTCRVLAVTEAQHGARLYWNGDVRRFRPPECQEVDATGAGDIFAAAFFIRLHATHNPWEAARYATHLAAQSVGRVGLQAIPTPQEIQDSLIEVI